MVPRLYMHFLRRLFRPGRVIGLAALAAAPGVIFWLLTTDTRTNEVTLLAETAGGASITFALAALILTAATLRDERDAGTLPYIYLRPYSRLRMATTALLAAMTAALLVGLAGWLATALAVASNGLPFTSALRVLVLYAVAAIGYAAIFVPIGYLVPRALLVGLAYLVVWEQIIARAVEGLSQTSVWRIGLSLYADIEPASGSVVDEMLGSVAPGWGGALVKIVALCVLGTALLTWALRHRDAV